MLTGDKRFGLNRDQPLPSMVVTGTDTGAGLFCAGVGYQRPDVKGASRRIAASEFAACQRNGVNEITESAVGMDARTGGWYKGMESWSPGLIALAVRAGSGSRKPALQRASLRDNPCPDRNYRLTRDRNLPGDPRHRAKTASTSGEGSFGAAGFTQSGIPDNADRFALHLAAHDSVLVCSPART